jgi:hypothetical protein
MDRLQIVYGEQLGMMDVIGVSRLSKSPSPNIAVSGTEFRWMFVQVWLA